MGSYRKEKIASAIRELVGEAIAHKLQDPRVSPLTTVTRVEVSPDLLIAKVFISTHGGNAAERRTISGLRHAGGFIQRIVAKHLSLRLCPEVRFEIDEVEKGVRAMMDLLDENKRQRGEPLEVLDDGTEPSSQELSGDGTSPNDSVDGIERIEE